MTTAQAASRLGVDASTIGKYIRRGLVTRTGRRIYLKASRRGRGPWAITGADVADFRRLRRAYT